MEIISSLTVPKSSGMNGTHPREDTLARQSDVTVSNQKALFTEYKGFFIHVISSVILICFMIWGLVPSDIFEHYLNFDYFPNKYWFVAIPAYSLMLMAYIYIALAAYNTEIRTASLNDIRNFVDEFSFIPQDTDLIQYIHKSPSGVCDLPITLVNEVLYNSDLDSDLEANDSYEID